MSAMMPVLVLLHALVGGLLTGCGTIPDTEQLIKTQTLHLVHPRFVGPYGSLTREQGRRIIARIQSHQETPTDILQRHIGFEQAISDAPLVVGNKVTLLKNASATYPAMLAAIQALATTSIWKCTFYRTDRSDR